MLALSLIVSSIVEIIHRTLKLRERGLEYMLRQLFDQVLVKYVQPLIDAEIAARPNATAQEAAALVRESFVKRMTANRAPIGLPPDPTLAAGPARGTEEPGLKLGNLWGGRRVTALSPTDFMERLGSIDIGAAIKSAAETAAPAAGREAADRVDAVIKDIAQKFDGFGKDAGAYFEGRARLMSVFVAIALAFVVHVDAIDLFRTYLRDPNARAKVIEQSQAVTEQYKAAKAAAEAASKLAGDNPPPDATQEVKQLSKDLKTAIEKINSTVTEYADLGVPLGWTPARKKDAGLAIIGWFCPANRPDGQWRLWSPDCTAEQRIVWLEVPTEPGITFYLLLGGLLIGLGSPFWYDAITSLTNLRSAAQGKAPSPAPAPPAAAPGQAVAGADKPQPVTPAGAFDVAQRAAMLRR
jgi:hypothetical protein